MRLRGFIALAAVAALVFAGSAGYGQDKRDTTLSIPDGVYGGEVVALTNAPENVEGTTGTYVLLRCYVGDVFVHAKYFEVIGGQATVGPLESRLWPVGAAATCHGAVGYFGRDGFGRWRELAAVTFSVAGV